MTDLPVVVPAANASLEEWSDPVRGNVGFRTLISGDVTPSSALTAGLAELAPGGWLGEHRHDPAEVYFVTEGEGASYASTAGTTRWRQAQQCSSPGDARTASATWGTGSFDSSTPTRPTP